MVEERSHSLGKFAANTWQPAIDICESKSSIMIRVEVPGTAVQDLSVRLKGDRLILGGIKRRPHYDEKPLCYIRLERAYGEFSQDIEINWPIDIDRANATVQDGILTIQLPKLEKVVDVPIVKK